MDRNDDFGPGLDDIARLLREERPLPDDGVLERARLRARSRAGRRAQGPVWTRKRGFMRSRIAITAVLVMGMLMMATSAGLAISGSSGDGSAASSQYRDLQGTPSEGQETPDGPELLGDRGSGGDEGDEGDVQAVRQVGGSGGGSDKLPFTGFAAIFLLVGGVALLGSGLALRRSARREAS